MKPRASRRPLTPNRRGPILDNVTAAEVQSLERTASERVWWYWFSPRLEREFEHFVRYSSRRNRLILVVSTALMFLTVPLWGELLLGTAAAETLGPIAPQIAAMGLFFCAIAWLQYQHWDRVFVEWLLLAAFVAEAMFIEYLRFESERVGLWIDPSTSLVVPLTVVLLGRFRVRHMLLFVAGTVVAMLYAAHRWPITLATRSESTWLIQAVSMSGVVVAAISSKIDSRRQWASAWLLQMMAFRDSLTGLPNRRALENHHDLNLRPDPTRTGRTVLLALIDLDHFKKINDRYGHDYGDGVLAEFAMTLNRYALNTPDIAARIGGEEFCLLIPNFNPSASEVLLRDIVSTTEALAIENETAPLRHLTCSVGAVVADANTPLSMLLKQADECLYEAKAGGRNTYRWRHLTKTGEQVLAPRQQREAMP